MPADAMRIRAEDPAYRGAQARDLPRMRGLYCLGALGSRGIGLAPLLAEALACMVSGEPLPIEGALIDAIDPARFLLRLMRAQDGLRYN